MIATCVAAPAVRMIVFEVARVSSVAVNCSVRGPTAPVIIRPVKVAAPDPSVFTVSTPPSVPPPDAIDTVTATPDWLTALLTGPQ